MVIQVFRPEFLENTMRRYQLNFAITLLVLALGQTDSTVESYSTLSQSCKKSDPWSERQPPAEDIMRNASRSNIALQQLLLKTALPRCKNITVKRCDFTITAKGIELHQRYSERIFRDFWISEDNQTAIICYSLSPQLLNCRLTLLDSRLYAYDESMLALKNCQTKQLVALADFYMLSDHQYIVGCNETVGYQSDMESRCQFIDLIPSEYEWMDENTTLRLLPSNDTINHAYTDPQEPNPSSNLTLCYPLSVPMTKCVRDKLQPSEYERKPDRSIYNLRSRKYLNFGDYIKLGDYQIDEKTGEVQFCKDLVAYTFVTPVIVAYILSIISLVSTITIHAFFPSINKDAMPLLCQLVSMAIFYFTMLYLLLWSPSTRAGSYVLFAFRYCSALATYFWLNILSFDLWMVFSNLLHASQKHSNRQSYMIYCAYAFGIPLGLTIFCLLLETHPSMQDVTGFHPDISDNYWFKETKTNYAFYAGPIVLQLCGNLIFFSITIWNLKKAFECVQEVNKERYKQLFSVCIKIFFTTGLSWVIIESFPFWAGGLVRYIAWIFSASQGLLIFIIYICKPYTCRIIRKKYRESIGSKRNQPSSSDNGLANTYRSETSMESKTVDSSTG